MIRKTFGKSNNLQKESNGNNAKGNQGQPMSTWLRKAADTNNASMHTQNCAAQYAAEPSAAV